MTDAAGSLVKLMSITRAEFEASLAGLEPSARLDAAGEARLAVGSGVAVIVFAMLLPRTIGGLLRLPQARVSLDLDAVPEAERVSFLRRFEIAFQRGGG